MVKGSSLWNREDKERMSPNCGEIPFVAAFSEPSSKTVKESDIKYDAENEQYMIMVEPLYLQMSEFMDELLYL